MKDLFKVIGSLDIKSLNSSIANDLMTKKAMNPKSIAFFIMT